MTLDCLPSGTVHLYLADTAALPTADRIRRYLAQLQPDELERYGRIRFEADRYEYLVTRALSRAVLSRYVARTPESWHFARTEQGRPYLAEAESDPDVRWISFNLSNTRGLVACAIARDRALGVDVERTSRQHDPLLLADRVLSAPELADLRSCSTEQRPQRFFDYWTLKEAYLKARGKGLLLPLDAISILLPLFSPIRLQLAAPIVDDAGGWQLELWSPTLEHRLALCVWCGAEPPLRVEIRWLDP
ncbi:MAG TPA: 4'-phosphopantetheinyl transferase superfamily protein [Anaeromyxobacteraceae bacterium]|nr:4'-phosphopantetheinyl transferase superfamily protein [Anaeromyxobacteraceae bacterium]